MIDKKNRFVIKDYGKKSGFSSFLPGISGKLGIPIWCYYVNRGQCITSFGVLDKDHSIMEFFPAHQAYAQTKKMGFRTFIKEGDQVTEPFARETVAHEMHIGMNELELRENNEESGLETTVAYITLPGERVGALVRRVAVRNLSAQTRSLEILDGMPAVIPYGIDQASMKEMGQTMKAWMETQDEKTGIPFFHVRASTKDSAQVVEVAGGNFGMALDEKGDRLPVIVDAEQIFAYDSSFEFPIVLQESSLKEICRASQITQNCVPCCFFAKEALVAPGEEIVLYEIYGQAESKEILKQFSENVTGPEFFEKKFEEAAALTEEITAPIATKTGSQVFDCYCRQTFLDNVLRGGAPVILGGNKLFYLYSRKHGDIERDYNFFSMLPEFYSQGNGNFRDVNQNRRCDVQFAPFVEDKNIKTFYNCIQINGYNPLGIEKITYNYPVEGFKEVFTPGELYSYLEKTVENPEEREAKFQEILSKADYDDRTKFIEGYWTDHWTYNLDLVEAYLSIYPEKEHSLLFEDSTYKYLQAKEDILPRAQRYIKTENGIRQYRFLKKNPAAEQDYLTDARGEIVTGTLAQKLFLLSVLKTAALDSYGMGVEMEGGKPGWYDALNGLPGLLGSSMCETYEVARNLEFCIRFTEKYQEAVTVPKELAALAEEVAAAIVQEKPEQAEGAVLSYWNRVNDAKEAYWKSVETGISGEMVTFTWEETAGLLRRFHQVVSHGVEKAVKAGKGISPSYFYYEVVSCTEDEAGIHPTEMKQQILPYFLEGPVRHLKLDMEESRRKELYEKVKNSDLYDPVLEMYKIDAPLKDSTFELGRCRAFTPGWLENESIWLHMEYKYLLELLKAGMYPEFLGDFHKAAVPFLSAETYGRSLFENSSFIASSVNPNPKIHGKGFVARLSGSTAEFLQMWQIMMFGRKPFEYKNERLTLEFTPLIPSYLIGADRKIEAAFLGKTAVCYELCDWEDYIPGNYQTADCRILWKDGSEETAGSRLEGETAEKIRKGQAERIEVRLKR